MKIFELRPTGGYCGGCMLVHASDEKQALEVAYEYEFGDKNMYEPFKVTEILGLHYDVQEPCVIVSALYFE